MHSSGKRFWGNRQSTAEDGECGSERAVQPYTSASERNRHALSIEMPIAGERSV